MELTKLPAHPLVSVIVPSFNQGGFIRETIDSILAQDHRPIEIIVIDGASTDATLDVLRSYGHVPELQWLSEPDSGVVEAVNKGFARVRGDIVAIQSSDDCYLPGALAMAVKAFREEPEVGLVYGDTVKVDANGREIQRSRIGPWSLENLFLLRTWIPQPSAFFRRELLAACGGWDERIPYAPDTDLWVRMAFRTQVRKLDEWLSRRRVHADQRDVQSARILRDYRRMIDQSPDIAAAPATIRRAASAGRELIYRRYNPSGSEFKALWHDIKGMAIFPGAFDARRLWGLGVITPLRKLLAPVKHQLGCWVHERWRAELALSSLGRFMGYGWCDLCNRNERVEKGDETMARYVETEYTSYLTVARVFPRVGARLARACFQEHPLPDLRSPALEHCDKPQVSVILPVGGLDRRPGFHCVLAALANQSVRDIEIIVLEHSARREYEADLPAAVRYVHVPLTESAGEFNKSLLFNHGVDTASASVVLLHDADIVVPGGYVEQALNRIKAGFEAVRPMRFLFYLDKETAERMVRQREFVRVPRIESVAQNSQGGSTMMRKSAYEAIGGHDDRFTGWGGEDLEFLERLRTRSLYRGGWLPAFHLWHPPARKKASGERNRQFLEELRAQNPQQRISRLLAAGS